MKISLNIVLIILFSILSLSCKNTVNNLYQNKAGLSNNFYFTHIASLPIDVDSSYSIEFYNWSDHTVFLQAKDFIIDDIQLKSGYKPADVVDVSQCNTLSSHSSCHIILSPFNKLKSTAGSFMISINHKEVKAVTIIKYFNSNKNLDFDVLFNSEDTNFNFNNTQPISLTIPIKFNVDFYNLTVDSSNSISHQFLNCDPKHIIKSTVCLLQINSQGGKLLADDIILRGYNNTNNSKQKTVLNTSISNNNSSIGNLLVGLSAYSIIVDGSLNKIIVFLANNGLSTISNITYSMINTNSLLAIVGNTCASGIITSNSNCYIHVEAIHKSTVWNMDGVNIHYYDGFENHNLQIPIIVKPSANSYGSLTLTTSGNMVTTQINHQSTVTVTVSNNGDLPVNNINTNITDLPATIHQLQNNCSNTLASNDSCQIIFQYNPTSATALNNFSFVASGEYMFANQPVTISNKSDISYSAVDSSGYLLFNINDMLFNINVNHSTVNHVIVTNNSSSSISNMLVDFSGSIYMNQYSVVNANVDYSNYPNCTTMVNNLAPGAQCVIAIKFDPTTVGYETGVFKIDYLVNGMSTHNDLLTYQSNVINGDINISVSKSISGYNSGSGIANDPYKVNTTNGDDFAITYTYTNTGSSPAQYLTVFPTYSAYYNVTGVGVTPCPINSSINLQPNQSCQLEIKGLNPNLPNLANISGAYNLHTPGVSFKNLNGDMLILDNFGDTYIDFNALYTAQILPHTTFDINAGTITSQMIVTILSANAVHSIDFVENSAFASGVTYSNDGSSSNLNTCTVNSNVGASCYINMTYHTLASNDSALFKVNTNGLISWIPVANISALAYFYTQNGTDLKAWKLNTDYSFNQLGASIPSISNDTAIIYNHQLLLFKSTAEIIDYPINNDGSLANAISVTVNPAFNGKPEAATVSQSNGSLYVATTTNPGATAQITTYKCGNISAGNISCTAQTSSNTYDITNITNITSGFDNNALYYSITKINSPFNRILYSLNDGLTISETGASSFAGITNVVTSNYRLDKNIFFTAHHNVNVSSYNLDGTINMSSNIVNTSDFGYNIPTFFFLKNAMNYLLPVPVILGKTTPIGLSFIAIDNSISSNVLEGNNATVYVPLTL